MSANADQAKVIEEHTARIRNSIAEDLWNEEQRASEAQRRLTISSPEYQYLSGVLIGLMRARDIVEQQGPPPTATLEEREALMEKALREPL